MSLIEHAPRLGRHRHFKGFFVDVVASYIDPASLTVLVVYYHPGKLLVRWSLTLAEWNDRTQDGNDGTRDRFTYVGETPGRADAVRVLS